MGIGAAVAMAARAVETHSRGLPAEEQRRAKGDPPDVCETLKTSIVIMLPALGRLTAEICCKVAGLQPACLPDGELPVR